MMGEQRSLKLNSPLRPDVFYFALRPDAVAAQAMMDVAKWCRDHYGLTGRPCPADRLHVSLSPAASRRGFRKGDVAAALRAAARVSAKPFPAAFDRICTFGGRDRLPIVLCCDDGNAALAALRHTLRSELLKVGLWRGPAQFQPHVTLLWDKRSVPDTYLNEPICWTVADFVLVRSIIGCGRHVDVGRWSLRGWTKTERLRS
ncbi:MAG: 2'-5' RNA ligase family protein [Kiloniellales bacterium]